MLQPFFGSPTSDPNDPDNGRFNKYINNAHLYFAMTSPDKADTIIYPTDWNKLDDRVLRDLLKLSSPSKPLVVFHNDDSARPIYSQNIIVYRTSTYRSNRQPYEYGLPAWSKDLVNEVKVRPKSRKPSIGFCGVCQTPLRNQLVSDLNQCKSLDTNFIRRGGFWAGALSGSGFTGSAIQRRKEFVDNILNNDFSLCPPGAGNFSYRLYEVMSCGRIPIIPETGQVLPYEDDLDWSSIALFVTADNIEDKILVEYDSLDDFAFAEKQRKIRKTWETHLSPDGFFSKLEGHIRCMSQK